MHLDPSLLMYPSFLMPYPFSLLLLLPSFRSPPGSILPPSSILHPPRNLTL